MREILNKLHLSIREFAELYEIPYQTIRQWTVGERRMPDYLKKLIEKDIDRRTQGNQLKINGYKEWFWLQVTSKYGTTEYLCFDEEQREMILKDYQANYKTVNVKTKNLIEYLDK